jgi:hypothetical protein
VIPADQFVGWMEQVGLEAVRNRDQQRHSARAN